MGLFNKSATHCVVALTVAASCITTSSAFATNTINLLQYIPHHEVFQGIASFYDDPGLTSSGETYDPKLFTAAVQIDIRAQFGGVRYGRLYQPVYAIAEYNGKRAIVKLNDVGPLKPGRKFDLSRIAMEYFGGIELGLLPDFKMTLLPRGRDYTLGPIREDVVVAEVQELYKTQARLLAPIDPIETIARNEDVAEFDTAVVLPPARDDDIVTASTDKSDEAPAIVETETLTGTIETDAPLVADTAVAQPAADDDHVITSSTSGIAADATITIEAETPLAYGATGRAFDELAPFNSL